MSPTPLNAHDAEIAAALPARLAAEAAAAAEQAKAITLPAVTPEVDYDLTEAQQVSKVDGAEEAYAESV